MGNNAFGPGSGRSLTKDGAEYDLVDAAEQALGGQGFYVISTTAATPAPAGQCFFAIQPITATTIAALTPDASAPITGTATGIAYPINFIIYGKFSSITLTSGSCIAYLGQI
jgi:hypothetical protein